MKHYRKEFILLLIQLLMFYLFPLTAGPADMMGMVIVLLFSSLILSVLMGLLSGHKIKFAFPPVTSLIFLPSVFIHYNTTALPQCIWYFVISLVGLCAGSLIRYLIRNSVKS